MTPSLPLPSLPPRNNTPNNGTSALPAPTSSSALPAPSTGLPTPSQALPTASGGLPTPGSPNGSGNNALPTGGLPSPSANPAPATAPGIALDKADDEPRLEDFKWDDQPTGLTLEDTSDEDRPAVETVNAPSYYEPDDDAPELPEDLPVIETHEGDDPSRDGLDLDEILINMLDRGGSDLHLSAGSPPATRVRGDITPLVEYPALSGEQIDTMMRNVMTTQQKNRFEEDKELDFAHDIPGKSRFRVNVMVQKGVTGAVLRAIPWEIKTIEELSLPPILSNWAHLPRGLVLITGPTGSGKSTTLASIIDYANRTRASHIMTIEDPIEFTHQHKKSIVNQREVGSDTHSFADALKHVLRQDPDIILVGELRDLETISIALTAAETGHLVFGTLHTQSASETITRIIDVFPEGAQQQVRTQLAGSIQGIACQALLKTYDGKGRVAATEVLVATDGIRANIRDNKIGNIYSALQLGQNEGMQTLDATLEAMVKNDIVHWEEAAEKSTDRNKFINLLGGEEAIKRLDAKTQRSRGGNKYIL